MPVLLRSSLSSIFYVYCGCRHRLHSFCVLTRLFGTCFGFLLLLLLLLCLAHRGLGILLNVQAGIWSALLRYQPRLPVDTCMVELNIDLDILSDTVVLHMV